MWLTAIRDAAIVLLAVESVIIGILLALVAGRDCPHVGHSQ